MINKNNNPKIRVINLGKRNNKDLENGIKKQNNYYNQKKTIESYNAKINGFQFTKKKIYLETNTTFDKKNNLSLFSFLSSNTNQDDKIVNKSIKTTKETDNTQINLKYSNISNKKKYFFYSKKMGSTINQYNSKPTKNNELNKELDKFKNRIDSLMKVIEDFEVNYINSSESKRIKDELNDLINSKNYFSTYECHSSQKSMKLHKRQIYFRESNKNIFNKFKNNNKTVILQNHKLCLLHNTHHNNYSSTKNINNNTSIISSKNGRNKNIYKKELNKNNNNINSYNRRINYSSLLEVKSLNKEKGKKSKKEKKKIYMNKNNLNKNKPITHHYPSKSNDVKNFESLYNERKTKNKDIINNNIYITPTYNKTPKIYRIKEKITKIGKQKSNNNDTNTKKKVFKK